VYKVKDSKFNPNISKANSYIHTNTHTHPSIHSYIHPSRVNSSAALNVSSRNMQKSHELEYVLGHIRAGG